MVKYLHCNLYVLTSWIYCEFFLETKKNILLFSNDALNLLKVTVKMFIMPQTISISNKCSFLELSIKNKKNYYGFHKSITEQLFSDLLMIIIIIIILNVSWAANQHITMISEGSCDTEDWSNICWKFRFVITGLNYILKYIKIENSYFRLQ